MAPTLEIRALADGFVRVRVADLHGRRVVEVVKAVKGGTPIAKWMDTFPEAA